MKVLASIGALLVAGLMAAVALAGPQGVLKKKPSKVTMCHLTNGKKLVTIRVAPRAVRAHLRVGDKRGACPKAKVRIVVRTVTETVTVTATPTTSTTTTTGSTTSSSTSSSSTSSTSTTGTTTGSTTTTTTT
jgi:hypothetical protein